MPKSSAFTISCSLASHRRHGPLAWTNRPVGRNAGLGPGEDAPLAATNHQVLGAGGYEAEPPQARVLGVGRHTDLDRRHAPIVERVERQQHERLERRGPRLEDPPVDERAQVEPLEAPSGDTGVDAGLDEDVANGLAAAPEEVEGTPVARVAEALAHHPVEPGRRPVHREWRRRLSQPGLDLAGERVAGFERQVTGAATRQQGAVARGDGVCRHGGGRAETPAEPALEQRSGPVSPPRAAAAGDPGTRDGCRAAMTAATVRRLPRPLSNPRRSGARSRRAAGLASPALHKTTSPRTCEEARQACRPPRRAGQPPDDPRAVESEQPRGLVVRRDGFDSRAARLLGEIAAIWSGSSSPVSSPARRSALETARTSFTEAEPNFC